jgi:uncharacterized membrane protein
MPAGESKLEAPKPSSTLRAIVLLAILTAVVLTPYAIRGLPLGADAPDHLVWADAFFRQLAAGEVYPRWLVDVGRDAGSPPLGSPVFFFYPPLPFFLSSAFGALSLDPSRQLVCAAILSIWVGVIGTYIWLRNRFEAGPAAVGAALYLLMPYHLIVDFATRTAYAELWGLAWLPWVLNSVDAAARSPRRALCLGALATSLLLLSHPPTSLTFLPLSLAYAMYVTREVRRAAPILTSIASWCLGGGLAAVYLLPALTQGGFVQQEYMFNSPRFYYGNWFFFHAGPFHRFITAVTTFQVGVCWLGVGAIRVLETERRASNELRLALASAVAACAYLFLNFQASDFLWKYLPLLSRIQFPWRINSELLVCIAITGACLAGVLLNRPRDAAGQLIARIAAVGVLGLFAANVVYSLNYAAVNRQSIAETLRSHSSPPEHRAPYRTSPAVLFKDDAQTVFVSGSGQAAVAEWRARHIEIDVAVDHPGTLAIAQQFYPGWSAVITPVGEQVPVDRLSIEYGVLAVDVPAGRSRVSLRLGWTPNERLGWQLSAICSLVLLSALLLLKPPRQAAA